MAAVMLMAAAMALVLTVALASRAGTALAPAAVRPGAQPARAAAPRALTAARHGHRRLHCFRSPRSCGYPDPRARRPGPAHVGPRNARGSVRCSSLRPSGSITVTRAGRTVRGLNVRGRIQVDARNVTIDNVCVTDDGSGNIGSPPAVEFNATGGRITNSDVRGANATNASVEIALGENVGSGYRLAADHDFLHNCGECVHNDGWTLTNSYVITNGNPCSGGYRGGRCQGSPDHREAIYCDTGAFAAVHDTLLDPENETAALFCNTDNGGSGPCANQVTVRDSLLAGGSWAIIPCAHATSMGTSHMTVTANDFARCTGRPTYQPRTGGTTCGSADRAARDGRGFWPRGGYFGAVADAYCPPAPGQIWRHNFWDDTGERVACR